jgi:hypothetical protein
MRCSGLANVLAGVALICAPRRDRPSGRIIPLSGRYSPWAPREPPRRPGGAKDETATVEDIMTRLHTIGTLQVLRDLGLLKTALKPRAATAIPETSVRETAAATAS